MAEELKKKYESLFKEMVDSKDTKKMMLFGSVMNEMMERAIQRDTQFAQQAIEKLESMNWYQYLTKGEAEDICGKLLPEIAWSYDRWEKALESLELETEMKPQYNKYALWAVMNVMSSIHSETIAQKFLEITLQEMTSEQMIQMIHGLAVDFLTNKDVKFDVREFFHD